MKRSNTESSRMPAALGCALRVMCVLACGIFMLACSSTAAPPPAHSGQAAAAPPPAKPRPAPPVVAATPPGSCTPHPVYFALDSSLLDDGARNTLASDAQCIVRTAAGSIQVSGMADARGTEEYNLALSDRRARSVMSYLGSFGLDATRVTIRGLGEEMAQGKDESGWSRDRRAEISIP
jgi:peptidoglycan-associated lipoprotein